MGRPGARSIRFRTPCRIPGPRVPTWWPRLTSRFQGPHGFPQVRTPGRGTVSLKLGPGLFCGCREASPGGRGVLRRRRLGGRACHQPVGALRGETGKGWRLARRHTDLRLVFSWPESPRTRGLWRGGPRTPPNEGQSRPGTGRRGTESIRDCDDRSVAGGSLEGLVGGDEDRSPGRAPSSAARRRGLGPGCHCATAEDTMPRPRTLKARVPSAAAAPGTATPTKAAGVLPGRP